MDKYQLLVAKNFKKFNSISKGRYLMKMIGVKKTKKPVTRQGMWTLMDIVDCVNGLLEEDGSTVTPLGKGDVVETVEGRRIVVFETARP